MLFSLSRVSAQTNYYGAAGSEYLVAGTLLGDQVHPDMALNSSGGFLVWQDNATDGSGLGISAQRLDATLSGTMSTFRVNVIGTNDQENARVTLLKNGGAAFVWQGGIEGLNQRIYARFLTPTNTWLSSTDVLVGTFTKNFQVAPAIATLNNSNVVIVWASYDQVSSNSLLDVYGQILSQNGAKIGPNFLVNQFTGFNQRAPAVAALKNGGFVVAWISEQQRTNVNAGSIDEVNGTLSTSVATPTVDLYARLYNSNGVAAGSEFLAATDSVFHANPAIAVGADGNFDIAWSGKDINDQTNSWDIYVRSFTSAGAGGATALVNTYTYGDQYLPRVTALGTDYLVAWTSIGEDGNREGVYGRFLHGDGSFAGNEFRINTQTIGSQLQPVVASDGIGQFLVVWSGF
ncbi:MAG TPA: hypothetical protein VFV81_05215, partial [Verrucomicrobiae bacterium]|nr:hypothetical protein [Verrucomicrobiae bacterium]